MRRRRFFGPALRAWRGIIALLLVAFVMPALPVEVSVANDRPNSIVIGVLAYRPAQEVAARWQALASYLESELDGVSVRIAALNHTDLDNQLKRQGVDLVLTNAGHYIALRRSHALSGALVTLVTDNAGVALDSFGGVIVTRADRYDIRQLRDLAGRRIAAIHPSSLGGYQAQQALFLEQGIAAPDRLEFVGLPHDKVIDAVVAGTYDVGFVRSGLIEAMVADGHLNPDMLRVVNAQQLSGFPHAVSTRLYPEWPLFASPHVSPDIVRRVIAALLLLEPDSDISRTIGIHGFTVPADYAPVEDILRKLRLPPFDTPSVVTWGDVWAQFNTSLIIIASSLALLLLIGARMFMLGRSAQLANQRFNQLFSTVPTPIVVLDNGVFTDCNPATLKALGCADKSHIIGKTPVDISPPRQVDGEDSAIKASRIIGTVLDGESATFEWVFMGANGCKPLMEVTLLPIKGNNPRHMLSIWFDIAERHRAHQLISSELALFSNGPVIVIEWGPGTGWPILSVSSNVELSLGYTQQEITAKGFDFSKLLHPDDLERIRQDSREAISSNKTCWEQSYRLQRKTGGYAWYYDFTQAVRDEGGRIVALRGYLIDQTSTKQLELQLAEERKSLFNILWGTGVGTWEWNVQTGETRFNERWAEIIGYTLDELSPISIDTWTSHVHADDLIRSGQALQQHFAGQAEHYECEARMRHRNGHWVWVLDRGKVVEWDESGQPLWVSGTHLEITARKRVEEQHRSLIEALSDAGTMLMVIDADNTVRYMNRIMQEEFGDKLGENGLGLIDSISRGQNPPESSPTPYDNATTHYRASGQHGRIFDVTSVPYTDTDGTDCRLQVIRDVTLEHHQTQALEHIAYHDPLTGLANRPLLSDRLSQAIVDARRRNQFVALAYIDLDGFKDVNDQFGHPCGDALLTKLARRMKDALRESDTVARLGGDEFAVVLRDLATPEVSYPLIDRLLTEIARPTTLLGSQVQVSASIGVSFYPQRNDADPEKLLRQADQAMYEAKTSGKNQIKIFGNPLENTQARQADSEKQDVQ